LNILTKICVVVLLVLVLFACVTFIKTATVPQNWRYYHERERDRATLNEQAVRYQKLLAIRQELEMGKLRGQTDQLAAEVTRLKTEKVPGPDELRTRELVAKLDEQNTRLNELQLTVKAMSERNKQLQQQLDQSRSTVAQLQQQNRRQTADITELRGEVERQQGLVRGLQRQLQDRDERIKELEQQIVQGVPRGEKTGTPGLGKISGRITAVQGELASINIGSAHGVTRGLKLYICRDASLVGYLLVDEVEEGEAGGKVVDKQLDPIIGDKVTNTLH
jgi:uncharacterized phage infection (PIP) family protein YhgE